MKIDSILGNRHMNFTLPKVQLYKAQKTTLRSEDYHSTVKPRFSDLQNSEKPPFSEKFWVDGNLTT